MILYRSMKCIFYHLMLVVDVWLVKMLKIVEKLSGLYGSATIEQCSNCHCRCYTDLNAAICLTRAGANDTIGYLHPRLN